LRGIWQNCIAEPLFSDDLALVQGRSDNDTDDNDLLASPGLAYGQEALAGTK
jgi:hypothetical protein